MYRPQQSQYFKQSLDFRVNCRTKEICCLNVFIFINNYLQALKRNQFLKLSCSHWENFWYNNDFYANMFGLLGLSKF